MNQKLAICLLATTVTAAPLFAESPHDLDKRVAAATTVVQEIMHTPDGGIPMSIAEKATCIAVIPSVKKAAFVVGASYGQGVVTCRTAHGWSAPVFIRLAGASFGFQIGGQATDLVLVAVNDKGFQDLLKSKFKIGADACGSGSGRAKRGSSHRPLPAVGAAYILPGTRRVCRRGSERC